MITKVLHDKHAEILHEYLEKRSGLIILLLDKELRIRDYNHGFLKLVGADQHPDRHFLSEYLLEESREELLRFLQEKKQNFRLGVAGKEDNSYVVDVCNYDVEEGYLMFGEVHALSGSEIIEKFSVLNNELTNAVRELNKKNHELKKSNDTINRLLRIDPLTNLYNRRYFFEELEKAFAMLKRHHLPSCLATMDLDHFKAVNDHWGHLSGDEVLKAFAGLLQEETREEDTPARIGGEEFTVLLHNTDMDQAVRFAERVRQAWSDITVPPVNTPLTVSIGVARLQPDDSAETLVSRADQAMYLAKEKGRNRVEVCRKENEN